MTVRLTAKSKPGPQPTAADVVDELIRKLASEVDGSDSANEVTASDVLLDTEIEGIRCVLTRAPRSSAPAAPEEPAGSSRSSAPPPSGVGSPQARDSVRLSPREREIARMVAQGYPNKIIADLLEISLWTVGTHLRRMFAKFAVTSRAAMVASAISAGLLETVEPERRAPSRR